MRGVVVYNGQVSKRAVILVVTRSFQSKDCVTMKQVGHDVVTLVSICRTLSEIDISAPCNSLCHCSGRDYDPVCGVDKVSYFSPCHAGCTVQVKDKEKMKKTNLLSIEKVGTEDKAKSTTSGKEPRLKPLSLIDLFTDTAAILN